MSKWSRSLNIYMVKRARRLKLLRTRGEHWKAVVELRGKRTYFGPVPAELVEKPAEQIIRFLAQRHGVEIRYFKGERVRRPIGKKSAKEDAEPAVKLVEDVVEWRKYSVKGDIWLLHVRKGLNKWTLCVTQLREKGSST